MYAITDTHSLIWYLNADPRLSKKARTAFDESLNNSNPIGLPTICIIEIIYLPEKNKIPPEAYTSLLSALEIPDSLFTLVPLDKQIAINLKNISRDQVPDMPDRIIAATAYSYNIPVISKDGKIKTSTVKTIW